MGSIPDPCLLVLTGGDVDALRLAGQALARPTELLDSGRSGRQEILSEVERRLRSRRLVAVLDAREEQDLRDALRGVGRKHCLPRVALAFGDEATSQRLADEGFRERWVAADLATLLSEPPERRRLACDRRDASGPFDLIGDVHGCFDELQELLETLGYRVSGSAAGGFAVTAPAGRRVVFLGDLVDRGPDIAASLRLALDMVEGGTALLVPGNHEEKLVRALGGADVRIAHGLDRSLSELEKAPELAARLLAVYPQLADHLLLDGGRLVAAHAGLEEAFHGRQSRRVRGLALFGPTSGQPDENGYPVRLDWARSYRGSAHVIYGHTPVAEARWVNRTINVDTGCVFGGALSALRWPEQQLVAVPAREVYWPPAESAQP